MDENDKQLNDFDLSSELLEFYHMADVEKSGIDLYPVYSEFCQLNTQFKEKKLHAFGGMKRICKIMDQNSGRYVAMAELKEEFESQPEYVEAFLKEARITAKLEHPSIIPIYELGLNEWKKPYFTMKFLRNQSLRKIIKELAKHNPFYVRKFTRSLLLEMFLKVCEGVAYAHSEKVIHLDLKPANIMIGEYGEVYVCDWGLAKIIGGSEDVNYILDPDIYNHVTLTGEVKGSPGYMAPEQIQKSLGTKNESSDIYALGAILFTILTYKSPGGDERFARFMVNKIQGRVQNSPAETAPSMQIPPGLNAICVKAMAFEQKNRYASVEDLISDVRAFQNGFVTMAEKGGYLKAFLFMLRRNMMISVVTIMALVVILFSIIQSHRSQLETLEVRVKQSERVSKLRSLTPPVILRLQSQLKSEEAVMLMTEVEQLLDIDPGNKVALDLKAAILFIIQDFNESARIFASLRKSSRWQFLHKLALKAAAEKKERGYLSGNTAAIMIREVTYRLNYNLTCQFVAQVFKNLPNRVEKQRFISKVISIAHNDSYIDVKIAVNRNGHVLDISGSKAFYNVDILKFLPIYTMDFSETSVKTINSFPNLHVREMNLSGCKKLVSINGLMEMTNLKRVTISKVRDSKAVVKYLTSKGVEVFQKSDGRKFLLK